MNQRFLLDWLYRNGAVTRPQLARDSGLSQPTVFATIANLEQAGLVRPSGQSDEPAGRPALVYEADPTAGYVLAVDLGHEWIRVVISDLSGSQLCKVEQRNGARTPKSLVESVRSLAEEAADTAELTISDLTCAIFASPGVYRGQVGRTSLATRVPGWQRPRLAASLEERLGVPVTIENDVNLAALSEYTEGAGQGMNPFAYLHVGTGIGLGVIINGELVRGATGAAGEIGFLPLVDPHTDAKPEPRGGLLQEALGSEAVAELAREAGMTGTITADRVFNEARAGSETALAVVRRQTEMLARLLASVSAFVDPELIVLGGDIGRNLDLIGVGLLDRVTELTPLTPRIGGSGLGADATVRGAVIRGLVVAREAEFIARMSGSEPAASETDEPKIS
jgi:predicted NBD/HSP70 family sugar kinase